MPSFEMTVVAKDMSQADSYIDIAVAETSPNIPEIKGTGLGLSIAKRICDILNIEIGISSKENIDASKIKCKLIKSHL